jgi:CheY-like chemotaxis protein
MSQILIVEDDADLRSILRTALELRGHRAVEAANGWEALLAVDQLGPERVDLILLDLLMPGMNGPTFLKILRSAGAPKAWIPVLVTSVLDEAEIRLKLGRLAVEGILPKRFAGLDDMLDRIDSLLRPPHDSLAGEDQPN